MCTWRHRRWGTEGMIDFGPGRFYDWQFVTNIRAMPGIEFGTDHFLLLLELRQAPQAFHPIEVLPPGSSRPKRLRVSIFSHSTEACQSFADHFADLREGHDPRFAYCWRTECWSPSLASG